MIVIKYGGHALPKANEPDEILSVIARHHLEGNKVVLVHGGGPQIDAELTLHGIEKEMVSGYRYTTPEVFEVVQQVLSGQVLRTLTNGLTGLGVLSIGLSAADARLITAKKFSPAVDGVETDIGLVGDIDAVNPEILTLLLESGYLPVVSPVAVNASGQGLNVNADIAAGAIAGALQVDEVIFMTDVAGIYRNWPDINSVISEISKAELASLQPSFSEGMVPKVKAALNALESGAKKVRIIDGRNAANLANAFLGFGGTVVVP